MSTVWTPLLPLSMIGTDRPAALPSWPGAVGELVAQAAGRASDQASGVLRVAAVLASCSLAGAQGQAWAEPLPTAAAEETLPALGNATLQTLLTWTLREGPQRLQHVVLRTLAAASYRLPQALLPQALELGRRSLALRQQLVPVIGARGIWLAAQREDWRYAAGTDADAADAVFWDQGSIEQRREFLRRERVRDPQAARERLTGTLEELPAKERADLLAVLAQGLSLDDEPLLENLRADRSREVRQAALALLIRLPDAAHPKRAAARIERLLTQERVLLRKRWQIDAPTLDAGDWKADNIDAARPKNDSLGERAWWLYQLVRQVPLAWWPRHTGLNPAELLQWAGNGDWAEALLRGWRDVLFAAPEPAWCEALLDHWPQAALRDDPAAVLALLPLADRERHWQGQLRSGDASALQRVAAQVLAACPAGETPSAALSATLVQAVRQRAEGLSLSNDYALRALLPELSAALHVDALDSLTLLPRRTDETASYGETLQTVTQVAAVRRAFHKFSVNPSTGTP